MSRRVCRRVIAWAALPLLALVVSTTVWASELGRCQMTGGAMASSCCCPKRGPAAVAPAQNRVSQAAAMGVASCCAVSAPVPTQTPVDVASAPRPQTALDVALPVTRHDEQRPMVAHVSPPPLGRAPPRSTPLLLAKRSLLI